MAVTISFKKCFRECDIRTRSAWSTHWKSSKWSQVAYSIRLNSIPFVTITFMCMVVCMYLCKNIRTHLCINCYVCQCICLCVRVTLCAYWLRTSQLLIIFFTVNLLCSADLLSILFYFIAVLYCIVEVQCWRPSTLSPLGNPEPYTRD